MRYSSPALVDHLAASYALGTLTQRARRRFERLLRDRVDVQLALAQWEQRLGGLAQSVPSRTAPPRVWAAIEARTRPSAPQRQAAGPASWLRPAGWGLGGVLAGAALALATLLSAPTLFISADQVAMSAGERLPQSYVGLLTDAQGNGKLLVSSLRHGKTMTVKVIGPIAPPEAGRLVLWAVPAQGPAFVLGEVPANGSAVSQLPDTSEKLLSRVTRLLVTQETAASPAAPGTPVYSGNCAKLW
ncbi:MAG: anti-sigma factor [Ramlibacter sp.]|nr:anti-sigma factor [Ramlibacter sp.]